MLQVFFIGLLLAIARWRTSSTLVTILMHVLANLWATIETMIKVEWLS
jgi:membrane protease YdiL (CAAX protease family)